MNFRSIRLAALCWIGGSVALSAGGGPSPDEATYCHTFSICALDPVTGETGVAVTTRVPEVGRLCPFTKVGVGAVATQAEVRVQYGPQGLELLEKGLSPQQVIDQMLEGDPRREHRQIGIIDAKGNTATHTGKSCMNFAGHRAGKNYTVQGNLLAGRAVIDATAEAFEATEGAGWELADRLIAALEAGHRAGGDKRTGLKQSAAIIVADPRRKHLDGSNISVNMQVAEHPEPLIELRRQYETIRQRLGYRQFRLVEGRDIVQLKQMLHALGYYRKDTADDELARQFRERVMRVYDEETADAVDRCRQDHGLPVPGDGLGHDRGVVDADFLRVLKSAYAEKRRAEAKSATPKPK
jgi:uncharacterized Ntn-hydrolase superfamily protein